MKERDTHTHNHTRERKGRDQRNTNPTILGQTDVGKSVRYEAVNVNELTFYAVPCCATVVEGLGKEVGR